MRRLSLLALIAAPCFTTTEAAEFEPDSSKVSHPAARHVMLDNGRDSKRTRAQMLESVAGLMKLDDAAVLALVSTDNGFGSVRCPVCQSFVGKFSLDDPEHVSCHNCETKFPNERFPETHEHKGTNVSGEPVTWRCYMKDGKGYQHFFTAVLRNARHHFLAGKTQDLARLYVQTKDERYAHRTALILVALGEAYPHWCAKYDHYWYGRYIVSERPWKGGVWGGRHCHEMPVACVFAYDHVYNSPVWGQLAEERGRDCRGPVEDWFRASHRMIMELQEDGGGRFGNLHPYTIRHVVAAGLVLNDPDMIHSVVPWFEGVTEGQFYFDGMWCEGTPDYHGQTTWNLGRAIRAIKGYTDPPGYVDRKLGIKLVDTDVKKRLPILPRADAALASMHFPDGRRVTVHDTHWCKPRREPKAMENTELNAYGHFALCRGEGAAPIQAHLHFCPLTSKSHFHQDRLAMTLYAAGHDVLPDIGYATDRRCYRYFATGRLSHNVSYAGWRTRRKPPEREFKPGELNTNIWARSSLLAYDSGKHCGKQVQLVEAESPGPAWEGIDTSRRLLLMVAIDDRRAYVFDLFRLRGGEWHESILRPSADEDCKEACPLETKPRRGTLAGEDAPYGKFLRGAGYRILIHDLRVGDGAQATSVTWTGKESNRTVRAFLNGQPNTEFLLARAPIIRPTRNKPSLRDKFQGPYLMRRREGSAGLTSCFAAVYDVWPHGQDGLVGAVQWLEPKPPHPLCIAAVVRIGEREDVIYCSDDSIEREVAGVTMQGRVAVLSRRAGRPAWGYLYGAGKVAAEGLAVTGAQDVQLPLAGADRAAQELTLGGDLPEQEIPAGTWLRVVHGDGSANGYATEKTAGRRITVRGELGFERTSDGMRMLFFPNYTIPGSQRVEICVPRFAVRVQE